jgi:hypothetical protein
MSGKFTHYLITRFNVPVKNWDRDKHGKPTLDEIWMKERLFLFTTYCVPTIAYQSVEEFTWIVYCDILTDPGYLNTIRQEVQKVPGAQLRLAGDFTSLLVDLREWLSNATTPYVITSRVDNDDGLGEDYIKTVQAHFEERDMTIINLNGGVLYDTQRKLMTRFNTVKLNHYGSLIEETDNRGENLTVLGYPHHHPPEEANVVEVPIRFGWLKIIHSRNLKSRTSGLPVLRKNMVAHFGLKGTVFPVSITNTIVYVLKRTSAVLKRKLNPGQK